MAKTAEEKKAAKAEANKRYAAKKKEEALAAKAPVAKSAPVAKKAPAKAKAPVAKKAQVEKKAKAPSKNIDVIADFLQVGDIKSIKSKSKTNLGDMVDARVVKIYACSRTGKDYVRLSADGHTYHKRLDVFAPVEAE